MRAPICGARDLEKKKAAKEAAFFHRKSVAYRPQLRTGPQSMCTKFDPE